MWIPFAKQFCPENTIYCIVGNKLDVIYQKEDGGKGSKKEKTYVSMEDVEVLSRQNGIKIIRYISLVEQSQYYQEVMNSLFYDLAVQLSEQTSNDTRNRFGSYKLKKEAAAKKSVAKSKKDKKCCQ